jgi:ATP-dependent RNA helicase DeaD
VNYHLPDVYEAYVHRSGRNEQEQRDLLVSQPEEWLKSLILIQTSDSISTLLWAKQIFKTKPKILDVTPGIKREKIKTVFHHFD